MCNLFNLPFLLGQITWRGSHGSGAPKCRRSTRQSEEDHGRDMRIDIVMDDVAEVVEDIIDNDEDAHILGEEALSTQR